MDSRQYFTFNTGPGAFENCGLQQPDIEELIAELRTQYSIVIVTHAMQQAARVSQRTAYFHLGNLVEVGATDQIFTNSKHRLTEDDITGRFG